MARPFAWLRTTSATPILPSAPFISLTAAWWKKPRKRAPKRQVIRRGNPGQEIVLARCITRPSSRVESCVVSPGDGDGNVVARYPVWRSHAVEAPLDDNCFPDCTCPWHRGKYCNL